MTDREFVRRCMGIAGKKGIVRAEAAVRRMTKSPERDGEMRRRLKGLKERVERWDGTRRPRRP